MAQPKKPTRTSYQCKLDKAKRNRHTRQWKDNQVIGKLVHLDKSYSSILNSSYKALKRVVFHFESSKPLSVDKQNLDSVNLTAIVNNPGFKYAIAYLIINNKPQVYLYIKNRFKHWIKFEVIENIDRVTYITHHSDKKITGSVIYEKNRISVRQIFPNFWELGIVIPKELN
jgi:hypothetical protein